MAQIIVRNLSKNFRVYASLGKRSSISLRRDRRIVNALADVSFSIEAGELVGYIGPNGAGKSTTIKVLSGILVPDSGTVLVSGRTPWKERVKHVADIGVVFGQRTQLWWDLPVIESFELLKHIYRVDPQTYRDNVAELSDLLELEPLFDIPVRQLSLGQRMRCDIAASLLHSPSILFLDEPTIGLDAIAKIAVREFIERINREKNITIILTTHDMDDIEALCRRVVVIGRGTILSDGTLSELRSLVSNRRRLIVDFEDVNETVEIPDLELIERRGRRYIFEFDPGRVPVDELVAILANLYPIRDLFVESIPIENIIADYYGGTA